MCLSVFWQWTLGGMMMVFLKGIRFQTRMVDDDDFQLCIVFQTRSNKRQKQHCGTFLDFAYKGHQWETTTIIEVTTFASVFRFSGPELYVTPHVDDTHLIIMGQYSGKLSAGVSKTQSYQRTFFKKLLIARSQEPCCIIWMSMNCWSNDHPGWLLKMKT